MLTALLCFATLAIAADIGELKVGDPVFKLDGAKAWRMDQSEVPEQHIPLLATIGAIREGKVWLGSMWVESRDVMLASVANDFFAQKAEERDAEKWFV